MHTTLPQTLSSLLHAARTSEKTAIGSNRRAAFRNTRVIIGALQEMGYSIQVIAEELAITPDSARDRADVGGRLSLSDIAELAGLDESALQDSITRYGIDLDPRTRTLVAIEVLRVLVDEAVESTNQAVGV